MERALITRFFLIMVFLALLHRLEGQPRPVLPIPPPRPLCPSQVSLANYACLALPFSPGAPPTPPSPDDPDDPDLGGRHHHHHHRHKHHKHHQTPEEENCCRWVKEVDDVCVCDLLVRLPAFLARPVHDYTVVVSQSCNVTYSCGSRLIRE
ncbi:hypothetical protein CFOL_v3_26186 [Cephalotus follicularis]|uniref:Bifunctional inhibitor/plant lipid transfer protein/seed storage helical domain-containing protein n=1 Tax=Cephalotus follicularis TaxID=3775 RepID=A0A1Q3CRD9_CEPFO|nr:hypothetical protein CFOL_v3_26186 [Cephalotus follicularis]